MAAESSCDPGNPHPPARSAKASHVPVKKRQLLMSAPGRKMIATIALPKKVASTDRSSL